MLSVYVFAMIHETEVCTIQLHLEQCRWFVVNTMARLCEWGSWVQGKSNTPHPL